MALVDLHGRGAALVDDEDYEMVMAAARPTWRLHGRYAATGQHLHGTVVLMHQLLVGQKGVDHINGDGLDNRRVNLRAASHQQNMANRNKTTQPTTSRFKGVHWHTKAGKWQAQLVVAGRNQYLGLFEDEGEAAAAYDAAARQAFGEFARPNGGQSVGSK